MRLGTRLDPRAEERLRRVSSSGGDEFVSRLTEGPIRTKSTPHYILSSTSIDIRVLYKYDCSILRS